MKIMSFPLLSRKDFPSWSEHEVKLAILAPSLFLSGGVKTHGNGKEAQRSTQRAWGAGGQRSGRTGLGVFSFYSQGTLSWWLLFLVSLSLPLFPSLSFSCFVLSCFDYLSKRKERKKRECSP